ncbi:hypothetical protein [Nannocystis punicea]|uniref:Uncharacterized protein n=1 Tax=Nannocystis punicea TaxID=2995304 RepID=A0ABY7HAY3_9BACT|nr:hypothetical protein [Nannocystis poenicansa]WAS96214.1 hypothetical protein O0S08_08625 [Nannocystis poenicansa]
MSAPAGEAEEDGPATRGSTLSTLVKSRKAARACEATTHCSSASVTVKARVLEGADDRHRQHAVLYVEDRRRKLVDLVALRLRDAKGQAEHDGQRGDGRGGDTGVPSGADGA